MTRSHVRCLTALVCSVSASVLLLAPAVAQSRPRPGLGGESTTSCTVNGPDRVCGAEAGLMYSTNFRGAPGATYSWTLHTTTTDGCPGTGTATPSFCGPTNHPSVCVIPGVNAGRFVLRVAVTQGTTTTTCCLSINVTATTFTTSPPPAAICTGSTHQFCTTSSGPGPFTYSWTKNGALVPGATDSCYTATAGPAGVIDNYCVTATGSGPCGTSYTACAFLTSLANTTVAVLPTPRRCEGETFQFCATAGGAGPFEYSWAKNGSAIPGATDSCYTATAATPGTIDSYCVTVDGACGPPVVRCGTLTAGINTVTSALTPASVCEGQTHQFCTTATGQGDPLVYSWTKNGATIPGATTSCYTATAGPSGTVDTYCVSVTGTCGTAQSCTTLTSTANTSTSTFGAASLCEGLTQQFCVTAGGTGPFTYSWTKNGVGIPGATASCYTATAGSAGTIDTYCAIAQGPCGPPSSSCFELTATASTILVSLPPASGCPGSVQNLCVTVSGTGPFTYAWSKNSVPIAGATDSCYAATVGAAGTVDTYCVGVAGTCGTLEPCTTVTALPGTAATEIGSASVCEGLTHNFCTSASGTGPFTYSWTKNAAAIPGATDSCYTATAGAGGAVDTYCVTVSGACGSVQRCATLTSNSNVTASALTNASKCQGATHQFCTTAGGTGPFTYSWTKNGAAISGATGSCYTATAGSSPDTYCVTVSGACGSVERCATLSVNAPTGATDLPATSGCVGEPVSVCTTASGTGPFTYSWTRNGSAVPGQTGNCYAFDLAPGDTQVCVTVTGACGAVVRCATLDAQACGGSHCTLTQGAYGNAGGTFNGMGRLALITDLLQGDMTVGILGTRSLTFQDGVQDAQCIIDRLPTSGSATTLPNFGDEVLESDCQTSPTPLPLQSGRFQNILLGQVITLSLNVRLASGVSSPNGCTSDSTGLSAQTICETMISQELLPGPDGCIGTADDVPGGGSNESITISDAVMDSLAALFLPQTVGGVLELGNRALAGLSTGTASLSQVSAAVDKINILFDECRELVCCQDD